MQSSFFLLHLLPNSTLFPSLINPRRALQGLSDPSWRLMLGLGMTEGDKADRAKRSGCAVVRPATTRFYMDNKMN
jgi:hypothetical protein